MIIRAECVMIEVVQAAEGVWKGNQITYLELGEDFGEGTEKN